MNKKGKFLTVLLLLVFALSMSVFGVACKKGDNGENTGSGEQSETKTATYYTDTADGEYVVELIGNACLLKIGSESMVGTFTLNNGAIKFVTEKGSFEGTINGDEISFAYGDKQYLMLEKIERTVTFSDGTTQKVINGKTAVKPATDPVAPENKAFVGWYADESYENLYNFGTPVRSDTNVYARMVDSPVGSVVYTATAIYDGGSKVEYKTVDGKVYGLEKLGEKDGKAFDGWYVSDFNSADKLTYKYNESIVLNQNVNLYPVWKDGITGVSVIDQKIMWDSYATGAKYGIKITREGALVKESTESQTEFNIAGYLTSAGEYEITVSTDDITKTVYYNHKALARPTVEIIDGTTVKYNAVANAEKYYVTVDCGNADHRHTEIDNGTSTVYDISSCEMQKGGIKVYVKAIADGYVSATSDVCRFERNLDAIGGIEVKNNTLVWNHVDNALSYVVVIDGNEYGVGAVNSYSLKTLSNGEHKVGVYPVTKGYNSPEVVETTYTKTALATPTGVTVLNGKIVWNAVEGATAYTVKIGDKAVTTDTNSVEFDSSYMNGKSSVAISVCAAVSGDASSESEFSDVCTVNANTMSNVKYENGIVSWNPVLAANGYTVTVGGVKTVVKNATSAKIVFNQSGNTAIEVAYTMAQNGTDIEVLKSTVNVVVYAVKFFNNNGTYNIVYAAYGDDISATASSVAGYYFNGWYDIPNGGKNNGAKFTDGKLTRTGDISLYAYLAPNKYVLTLDAVGGTLENENIDVYYNEAYTLPVPETDDENLVFDGWFSDVNGAGTRYTESNGQALKVWTVTSGATLKAYWKTLFNYTLNSAGDGYNVKGGDALIGVETVKIPETYKGLPIASIDDLSNGTSLISISIPAFASVVTGDGKGVSSSAFKACKNLEVISVYTGELKKEAKFTSFDGVLYQITKSDDKGVVQEAKLSMVPLGKTGTMVVYDKTSEINSYAFSNSKVEKVTIPASVTQVKANAFDSCSKLTEVEFEKDEGADLTLASSAFNNCSALAKVTLPARLAASSYNYTAAASTTVATTIKYTMGFDSAIFTSCASLAEVNIVGADENAYKAYKSVDGMIYSKDGRTLLYCPKGRTKAVTTSNATAIGAGAFHGCSKVEKVTVGSKINEIGVAAFYECKAIADLSFEGTKDDAPLTIKSAAFYYDSLLTEVVLPENLYSLEEYAFGYTSALRTVTVNSVGKDGELNFADKAFGKNTTSTGDYYVQVLTLANNTPAIGISAVFGDKITSLTIPEANANYVKGEKDEYYAAYKTKDGADYTMLVYVPAYVSGEFTLKSGINEISANTFRDRTGMSKVTIPASVEKIGDTAFYGCSALTSVVFEDGENAAEKLDIGANAFYNCSVLSGTVTLPARLTSLGESVFSNDRKLGEIVFTGTKLTTIGAKAFRWCEVLTDVVLPEGLKTIGESAFYGCESLESFTIPSTVTMIGADVLTNDDNLQTLAVAEGNTKYRVKDGILYGLIGDGDKLVEDTLILCPMNNAGSYDEATQNNHTVHIPNTVTKVEDYTFKNNRGIEQIIFDDNDADSKRTNLEMGIEVFYNSSTGNVLKKIVLPEGMTTITKKIFYFSYAEEIVVPKSVKEIQNQGFWYYMGKKITFVEGRNEKQTLIIADGTNNTSTYDGAFSSCYNLEEITFPEYTTKIGIKAFCSSSSGSTKLNKVVIPSTVTEIGNYAFYNNKNLVDITIVDQGAGENGEVVDNIGSLTTIGENAFYGTGFTTVALPSSLKTIGKQAFYNGGLTTITIPASVTTMGESALASNYSLETVYFEEGSELADIAKNLFNWSKPLATIGTIAADGTITAGQLPSGIASIGDSAFYYTKLNKVIIPASVKTIGSDAFGYTNLTNVTFATDDDGKAKLSSIGSQAFRMTSIEKFEFPETAEAIDLSKATDLFKGCFNLTDISVSSKVQKNLEQVLQSCVAITNVTVAAANENYTSANGIIYNKNGDTLVYSYIPAAVDQNGVLTITAKNVGANAYADQPSIKKVVFSKDVISIGASAFKNCFNLTEVVFAEDAGSITAIPDYAFNNCTSLAKVTNMPDSITSIGQYAFSGCKSLTSIIYGANVDTLGNYAFSGSGLAKITFPEKLKTLGQNVFKDSAAVTQGVARTVLVGTTKVTAYDPVEIRLPDTLKDLPNNAFANIQISLLTLPAELKTIGNYAFRYSFITDVCARSVTLPATVTSLGTYVFEGSFGLKNITIADSASVPSQLATIGNYAFSYSGLTSIKLPAKLKTLGTYAFQYSGNLTEVEFADDIAITTISNCAFKGCTALESIDVPAKVTSIGSSAFENCTSLKTVTLPDSLTSINTKAFMNSGITEITLPEKVKYISSNGKKTTGSATSSSFTGGTTRYDPATGKIASSCAATFAYCANLEKVVLSFNTEEIGTFAFFATPKLKTVIYSGYDGTDNVLPESLKTIGGYAFAYSGLETIKTVGNTTIYQNAFVDSGFKSVDVSSCISTSELPKMTFAYTSELTSVTLPSRLTIIGESAFEGSAITSVALPKTVNQIKKKAFKNSNILTIDLSNVASMVGGSSGDGVFSGAKNLAVVILGNKLTSLPGYTFENCSGLTGISVPASITSIGEMCFGGTALNEVAISASVEALGSGAFPTGSLMYPDSDGVVRTHITIDSANGKFYMQDNQLYEKTSEGDKIIGLFVQPDENGILTVPDGVVTIGSYAFKAYKNLKKVILPATVKYIENYAFADCVDLETVEMPAVEEINTWAFKGCYKLNYIKLPGTLTDMGNQIFRDASCLAEEGFVADFSELDLDKVEFGSIPFYVSSSLTINGEKAVSHLKKVVLPDDITVISGLFEDCENLEYVTYYTGETDSEGNKILAGAEKGKGVFLPDTVVEISDEAFGNCKKITYAEIPASVVDLDKDAYSDGLFTGCEALEEVKFLGNGITDIPTAAFKNCVKLSAITLPDSVTTIKKEAFSGCTELTSVVASDITEIYEKAFLNCAKLTAFDTSKVKYFGSSAFASSGLKEVVVNYNVVTYYVGNTSYMTGSTFKDCTELTKVTFGPDVTELCSNMFSGCTKLENITLPSKLIEVEAGMFQGSGIKSIVIPDSVTDVWANAFTDCAQLESVTIGKNTSKLVSPFYNCTALKEIYIPKTVTALQNTGFKGWGADQTIKFAFTEYQVIKLYGATWKDATCNAKVEYGVTETTENGSSENQQAA